MNYLFKKIIEQNQKERELEVCPQQNELRFNISSLLSPSMYVLKNSLESWQIFMKNAFRLSVKIVYLIAKFLSHSPHCVVGY